MKLKINEVQLEQIKELAKENPFLYDIIGYEHRDMNAEKPASVIDRIKTYEDACKELGIDSKIVKYKLGKEGNAFYQLSVIVKALNGGRYVNTRSEIEERWHPEFHYVKGRSRLQFRSSSNYREIVRAGDTPLLTLKSKELSDYCGKQFIALWREFLV